MRREQRFSDMAKRQFAIDLIFLYLTYGSMLRVHLYCSPPP